MLIILLHLINVMNESLLVQYSLVFDLLKVGNVYDNMDELVMFVG